MNLIHINRYGIWQDIRDYIACNRKKFIAAAVVFVIGIIFGIRTGVVAMQPLVALSQYNPAYFRLIVMIGPNGYVISQIAINIVVMAIIYLCCSHYFVTPLSVAVLTHRAYNFAATITLVLRIFGLSGALVVILVLIPFFLVLYVLLTSWVIYLVNVAQQSWRYGVSSWIVFETRQIWPRIVLYSILIIVISAIGGWLTTILGSSII